MANQGVAIGALDTLEDIRQAIRELSAWTDLLLPDNAPDTTPQFLFRDTDGLMRQYTLVNGGGCTIVIDEAAHTITISVP